MSLQTPLTSEQVERIYTMTIKRCTLVETAQTVGCDPRTVSRYRTRLGLSESRNRPWTDDEHQLALVLLKDGCPYREVARTLNRDPRPIRHKYPGYGCAINPIAGMHRKATELGLQLT